MTVSLISNPPYNIKWQHPAFAQMQPRFCETVLPPESNANFAFILTALAMITGKAVFLLPCSILTTENAAEAEIKRYLVEKNLIEAVVLCPHNMFESTDIPTCVLLLNKRKTTTDVMFVDMRETHGEEKRKQNGQYGGASHERRTYVKTLNVFRTEDMQKAIEAIDVRTDIPKFSRRVSLRLIAESGYTLTPARYIEIEGETVKHRDFADIIMDVNRVISEKNAVKLTVNETIARQLGLYEVAEAKKNAEANNAAINKSITFTGMNIQADGYISLTKNKNELSFSNMSKEHISSILLMVLQMWKQHIFYLNNEENRYLAELRDAMLPDLMSGKIKVSGEMEGES